MIRKNLKLAITAIILIVLFLGLFVIPYLAKLNSSKESYEDPPGFQTIAPRGDS